MLSNVIYYSNSLNVTARKWRVGSQLVWVSLPTAWTPGNPMTGCPGCCGSWSAASARTGVSRRRTEGRGDAGSPPGHSRMARASRCRAPLRESKDSSHMARQYIVSSWRKHTEVTRGAFYLGSSANMQTYVFSELPPHVQFCLASRVKGAISKPRKHHLMEADRPENSVSHLL